MVETKIQGLELESTLIGKFIAYLVQTGWSHVDHPNTRILLFHGPPDDEDQPLQLILPRDVQFQDAQIRIAEALDLLTIIHQEPRASILNKIVETEIDISRAAPQPSEILPSEDLWSSVSEESSPGSVIISEDAIRDESLNLNELINEVTGMLEPTLGEDIQLISDLDPRLKLINGDPRQIRQIIMNLVANSRDAMQNGGKLTIQTKNLEAHELVGTSEILDRRRDYVTLSVKDTGAGIDQKTQQRIFEPFFSTKHRALGLGLSVTNAIVKQLGGSISVKSEPQMGTLVQVQFPEAQRVGIARGATVLLVENEKFKRELIREVLEDNGYIVLEASDAEEATRLSQGHDDKINVLLSDIKMPEMSGLELIERIRGGRPDIKGLFMSQLSKKSVDRVSDYDVELDLTEGFAPKILTDTLRELVEGE